MVSNELDFSKIYASLASKDVDTVKSKYFMSARSISSEGDMKLKIATGVVNSHVAGLGSAIRRFRFTLYARWYNNLVNRVTGSNGLLTFNIKFNDHFEEYDNGFDSIPIIADTALELDNSVSLDLCGDYVWVCFIQTNLIGYILSHFNMLATYKGYVYELCGFEKELKLVI